MRRQHTYIGELPEGYEYRFIKDGENPKLIGIRSDKPPISCEVKDGKLIIKEIEV